MRTTLNIDDDLIAAVRDLGDRQHKTLGEIVSSLMRQALRPSLPQGPSRNGIVLLKVPPNATPVTLELVNQLRDELPE